MLAEHKRRFLRWTLPNSSEFPNALGPKRESGGFGAVVALCRTVAGRVPAWQCRAGKEPAVLRWRERCSGKSVRTGIRYLVLSQSCAALVLTMRGLGTFVAFPRPRPGARVCVTAWQSSVFAWSHGGTSVCVAA